VGDHNQCVTFLVYLKQSPGRGRIAGLLEKTVRFELRETKSDIDGRSFSANSRHYVFRPVSPVDEFSQQGIEAALQKGKAGFRDDTNRVRLHGANRPTAFPPGTTHQKMYFTPS